MGKHKVPSNDAKDTSGYGNGDNQNQEKNILNLKKINK